MTSRKLLLASTAFVMAVSAQPALAQESDEGASTHSDIIVTARKRQESILKVPVVETVLSAETLAKAQVTDLSGITQQVGGLQIGGNVMTVGPQIALRGVGTSALDAGVDQSVSINIDGVQMTQGTTLYVGLFDMAQVEVLKGPQALFFGKNSPGGVIAIQTADPGDETEIIARTSYEFYSQQKRAELIYSSPISDTVGIRLAGQYTDDNGYFKNKAVAAPGLGGVTPKNDRYNAAEEYMLRGTVVWEPTSDLSVRLKLNNTKRRLTGGGGFLGSCPDGNGAPIGLAFIDPNDDCKVDRVGYIVDLDPSAYPDLRNNGVPYQRHLTTFGTLEINYDIEPGLTLTSTSGYFDHKTDVFINGTNSSVTGPSLVADNQFDRTDYTQEIRLQSDWQDRPLNFLLGGYYQDGQVKNRIFVSGNTALGLPGFLTGGVNDVSIETLSAFGQLRYKPVEVIEIAAGVRYTDEKRADDAGTITGFFSDVTPVTVAEPELRSKNWSPELTITYTPTDDLTLFAAAKQGYKSGSYEMTLPPAEGKENSFGDERVRGGEVGLKARLFDRALLFNAAAYYYKYKDLQVGANGQAEGGLPIIRVINAASSEVYGLEFDLAYRPPSVPGLSTKLAVNYNHARFQDFQGAECYGGQTVAEGCNQSFVPSADQGNPGLGAVADPSGSGLLGYFQGQDLSGAPLPKAPDWTITGGIDYELPVGDSMIADFGVNFQYSSKFLRGLDRFDGLDGITQPSYVKLNANVSFGPEDGAWEVAVIGNNLTNKFTAGNCTQFSAATSQILLPTLAGGSVRNIAGYDELACIPDRGREVFIKLTFRPNIG